MATRSLKKTTTTTTVTRQGTPGSDVQSPVSRPPSPARISRLQEKEQLGKLNDRLANYIDKVRFLESENSRLAVQIQIFEETSTREVTNIKGLYENELADARKLLDELSKEKARLQIEANKYKTEAEEWMIKYNKKDRGLNDANKRIQGLEAQVGELEGRTQTAESEKKHYQSEYTTIKAELSSLHKQLIANKKQLEEETLLRVDIENRTQSLKEELAFKSQVHAQELNESKIRTEITMEEIDGKVQQEYEGRLADALRDMRAEQNFQLQRHREEIETMYETKLADLKNFAERKDGIASSAHEELMISKRRADEVSGELAKIKNQNVCLESRVTDLENELKRERSYSSMIIKQKQEEIDQLRKEIIDMMQEYKELMDIKIALDNEIVAYRKLIEGEEQRLNISSASEATPRLTPVRTGKRKRMAVAEEEFTETHSSTGFSAQSTAKGGVEIHETDGEGKFIKLLNTTDKDISLGGWQLKHTVGDQETSYKFHRSLNLKAGQHVTVWSANSDANHNPPHDLVMKGQRWVTGDKMKSQLVNSAGEDVAEREMTRSVKRTSYAHGHDVTDARNGEAKGDKSCVIM